MCISMPPIVSAYIRTVLIDIKGLCVDLRQLDNLKQQDIDDMRLKSITTSPIMQAIENCLDFLDEETMSSLVQPLQNALKTAVGVPTKVRPATHSEKTPIDQSRWASVVSLSPLAPGETMYSVLMPISS